jgi:hypothetical protein
MRLHPQQRASFAVLEKNMAQFHLAVDGMMAP